MPDAGRYAGLVRRWLDEGSARLAGERRHEIEALSPPPSAAELKPGPAGPPNAPWGYLGAGRAGRAFSAANLAWLLKEVARPPDVANLGLGRLDGQGYPGPYVLRMSAERQDGWLQLVWEAPERDLRDRSVQGRWLSFLRELAEDLNPSFGLIDYSYGDGPQTAVELTVGPPWRRPSISVPQSRRLLRGYGWLTILAQELGERLGGAAALRSSGAFTEVAPLARGGVWLLSTEDYRDFDLDALRRAFRVLAPVLPAGKPSRTARHGPPFRLVYEDASLVS